jgi:hypothetical protein
LDSKTPLQFIKETTDSCDIGEDFGKHPSHANSQYADWYVWKTGKTNERIIDFLNECNVAKQEERPTSWQLPIRWSKAMLKEHCAKFRTMYFTGGGKRLQRYTLCMIDVDCKRTGTPEGALQFLEWIRDNMFPNLYIETSTNGRGGHGFFLVDKCDLGAEAINRILLRRLAPFLDQLSKSFDVEMVEIKGTIPIVEWGEDGRVSRYTAGTLAKVPRDLFSRFDELRRTTVVPITELRKLPYVRDVDEAIIEYIAHLSNGELIQSPSDLRNRSDEPTDCGRRLTPSGSISGKHFTNDMLRSLEEGGKYHRVATELYNQKGIDRLATTDRNICTVYDLAVMLMLCEFCTNDLHENGGLPTKRIVRLWDSLFEAGDVVRPFNARRYSAMRNFLSDLGLIQWEDQTYTVGWRTGKDRGVCMKWRLSREIMAQLKLADMKIRDVDCSSMGNEHELDPLLIQVSQTIHDWVKNLDFCDPEQQIRPDELLEFDPKWFDPDRITRLTGCWETQAA